MEHRVIEINYDINVIPGRNPHNPVDPRVLRFRDATLSRLDAALAEDGLGHALGAELEGEKLQLRFVVMDFDAAEARVTWALDDMPNAPVAEIIRYWDQLAVA